MPSDDGPTYLTPDPNTIWTTKDGRKIPIVDLSDRHLANIVGFLRWRSWKAYSDVEVRLVLSVNTDAALNELLDMSCRDVMEARPIYKNLMVEANKRGLSLPEVWWMPEPMAKMRALTATLKVLEQANKAGEQ